MNLLWGRVSVNLKDGGHDGSLPIVLTLAHVTYVDRMLTTMNKQDRCVPENNRIYQYQFTEHVVPNTFSNIFAFDVDLFYF